LLNVAAVLSLAPLPFDPETLADLIERIAVHRDRAAFARLFGWYAPRLKRRLLRLGAAPARAEDLAIEAMAAVWRRASGFDRQQCSADTWVFRIARNLSLDGLRRDDAPPVGRLPGRMTRPADVHAIH
jgi:RNA polymerase sigma-70 factor, ECF subfamily